MHEEHYTYIFRISYMYYIVVGFVVTFLVALVTSLFFESNVGDLNPNLFFPVVSEKVGSKIRTARKKYSTTSKTVTFAPDL